MLTLPGSTQPQFGATPPKEGGTSRNPIKTWPKGHLLPASSPCHPLGLQDRSLSACTDRAWHNRLRSQPAEPQEPARGV